MARAFLVLTLLFFSFPFHARCDIQKTHAGTEPDVAADRPLLPSSLPVPSALAANPVIHILILKNEPKFYLSVPEPFLLRSSGDGGSAPAPNRRRDRAVVASIGRDGSSAIESIGFDVGAVVKSIGFDRSSDLGALNSTMRGGGFAAKYSAIRRVS